MPRFQYPIRTLLLLMIPAAILAGVLTHWFREPAPARQRSDFLALIDGGFLEQKFQSGFSGGEFSINRAASFGTALPSSGFWEHRFIGGLWGDQQVADSAIDAFRTNVKLMLRDKKQQVLREQVSRKDGQLVAFQIMYGDGKYEGILAVGYGEATDHDDYKPFRNLHIEIDEWIGHRQRPQGSWDRRWPSFFKSVVWESGEAETGRDGAWQ